MTTTNAPITHMAIDENGVPHIAASRSRVIDIVLDIRAQGMTPEQIPQEYPRLSLAQVYAALSYYYDHKAELDADIDRRSKEAEQMRAQAGESAFVRRMRAEGKLG